MSKSSLAQTYHSYSQTIVTSPTSGFFEFPDIDWSIFLLLSAISVSSILLVESKNWEYSIFRLDLKQPLNDFE